MLLCIGWTKQGERVHILATEGQDNPFVEMKSSSFKWRIVEIVHKEKEYQGDKVDTFNLRFEAKGQSHYFMMKSGGLALSVVNSLLGATTKQLEDIFISFYTDKDSGGNRVSVRAFTGEMEDKANGDQVKKYERLDWGIPKEQKDSLTRQYKGKGGKDEYDQSEYIKLLISKIPEANSRMPSRLVQGESSDLFDEVMDYSKAEPRASKDVSDEAQEYLDNAMGKATTPTPVATAQPDNGDIPFV